MWFGIWRLTRADDPRFQSLKHRYNKFRPEDTVLICDWHHAEIHLQYDMLIRARAKSLGKSLSHFTWEEAEDLMADLRKVCQKWMRQRTPGTDPLGFKREREIQRYKQGRGHNG